MIWRPLHSLIREQPISCAMPMTHCSSAHSVRLVMLLIVSSLQESAAEAASQKEAKQTSVHLEAMRKVQQPSTSFPPPTHKHTHTHTHRQMSLWLCRPPPQTAGQLLECSDFSSVSRGEHRHPRCCCAQPACHRTPPPPPPLFLLQRAPELLNGMNPFIYMEAETSRTVFATPLNYYFTHAGPKKQHYEEKVG